MITTAKVVRLVLSFCSLKCFFFFNLQKAQGHGCTLSVGCSVGECGVLGGIKYTEWHIKTRHSWQAAAHSTFKLNLISQHPQEAGS